MSVLYIEPFSGISGDMFLGALCGLSGDFESIKKLPDLLDLPDARVDITEVNKNGIVCKHIKVIDQSGQAKSNKVPHRHLKEIFELIDKGSISEKAKKIAREIFLIIGKSESKIHNSPLEKIHFHEISGIDSIMDIVGCAVQLDKLNVQKTYSDPVCTGFGKVKTQHGILPVPAPATADILQGMPAYKGDEEGEKTTPTGAAILKYLDPGFNTPNIIVKQTAYGPGEKDFKNPNVLRISLLEETDLMDPVEKDQLILIESNIDDSSPEFLGMDFQNDLIKNGAIDFYFTRVQMKKGRPGLMISVLAGDQNLKKVCNFILENTSTIGLRYSRVSRYKLPRRNFEIDTKYGKVRVKEITKPSGDKRFKIEYESLQELSKKHKIDIHQLQTELMSIVLNHSGS